MKYGIAIVMALVFASPALADEAAVRRMMQSKLGPEGRLESVERMPAIGFYEVVVRGAQGPRILYVDEGALFIVAGEIIDAKSGQNLTEARMQRLNAVNWNSLPFDWAVTTTRGSGRRKIAVFSDPNCPYCKRFENDLAKLDDITVHIFLYPVIKPESVTQTKSVWCSKDRAKAWNDLMLRDIQPAAAPDCDTPVAKLVGLGRRLGANATPTWFLENGERYSGALPLEQVRALLDAAAAKKR
jgi:thiol:disulfide interchange protein DsbC